MVEIDFYVRSNLPDRHASRLSRDAANASNEADTNCVPKQAGASPQLACLRNSESVLALRLDLHRKEHATGNLDAGRMLLLIDMGFDLSPPKRDAKPDMRKT
jgi:hypothetical protein